MRGLLYFMEILILGSDGTFDGGARMANGARLAANLPAPAPRKVFDQLENAQEALNNNPLPGAEACPSKLQRRRARGWRSKLRMESLLC